MEMWSRKQAGKNTFAYLSFFGYKCWLLAVSYNISISQKDNVPPRSPQPPLSHSCPSRLAFFHWHLHASSTPLSVRRTEKGGFLQVAQPSDKHLFLGTGTGTGRVHVLKDLVNKVILSFIARCSVLRLLSLFAVLCSPGCQNIIRHVRH